MTPAKRFALTLLGVGVASILLISFTLAGTTQLKNDNGEFYAGSWSGRYRGDIDGAVFTPEENLFPLRIQSVEFGFHRSTHAPWIADSAQVRVQIYAMQEGTVGEILAETPAYVFSGLDTWVSIPLDTPLVLDEPTSFMAAVKWESGDNNEPALPLALDSNLAAPQEDKDAKNLYHRVDVFLPEACQLGFCTHSELGLQDTDGQSMGFNMIRVTIDTPETPTETPATPTPTPTATPTVIPLPTPYQPRVYLPSVLRDYAASLSTLRVGSVPDEGESFALTSGNTLAGRCWPGVDNNLWVGSEPLDERGVMRSVIRFDLSALPAGAAVQETELRLVAVEAPADSTPIAVSVYNITRSWAWVSCPTWNSLASAVGESWGSVMVGPTVEVYTIDVTALVRQWLSGGL
ncbi:MAG: DNRLRE domain-containing protein, partial [Anaerolineae bacterium]